MSASPLLYTGGMVATNAYLIETDNGLLCFDAPQGTAEWIEDGNHKIAALVLTHGHFDHMWDAAAIQQAHGCPVHIHPLEVDSILNPRAHALFGIEGSLTPVPNPQTIEVADQGSNTFTVAGQTYHIAHIPGHSPGSVTFYDKENGYLIGGDVLFAGGIGRWDLPGGSLETLCAGIVKHLLPLPAETTIYPGHGPSTTIGDEAASNPFIADSLNQ